MLISGIWPLGAVRPTYPPKQGLRHPSAGCVIRPSSGVSDQPIHQNKDWDRMWSLSLPGPPDVRPTYPPKQGLRHHKSSPILKKRIVRPTYPPKQGLRHNSEGWALELDTRQTNLSTKTRIETDFPIFESDCELFCQTNLSTKTRIETVEICFETFVEFYVRPTYPPKQGLRHAKKTFAIRKITLVRPTYPPKQGLRHISATTVE